MKYLPVVGAIVMMIHVGLLLCGIELSVSEPVVITAITVLLLTISYALEFCWLHRLFILYAYIVMMCIYIQERVGFGVMLEPVRIGVFVTGGVLIGLLVNRRCCK